MGKTVAIIPARGGSKRIPEKNIKNFHGQPMISYPIGIAKSSGLFDRIIVSTDSEKVAEVAKRYGAEVPFVRPPHLSDDFTPTAPVVLHALEWLRSQGETIDAVCCIYATTPFLDAADLARGLELMKKEKANGAFSVTSFAFTIFRAVKVENGKVRMFWPENEMARSNDLPEAFHDAGQFYWLEPKNFVQEQKIWAKDALAVVLPRYRVQDIDTPEDWEVAERLYAARAKKS